MKSSTAYNHHKRLLGILCDIYSQAKIFKLPHDKILDNLSSRLYADPARKKLPVYYQGFLSGYGDALYAELRQHLVWKVYLDGRYVLGEDVPAGRWQDVEADSGCHFWKQEGGSTGSLKPFGKMVPERSTATATAQEGVQG